MIPVAVAGRREPGERLRLRDPGWETRVAIPVLEEQSDVGLAFGTLPMEGARSGRDVDLYWLDVATAQRLDFSDDSPFYAVLGFGWSLLYAHPERDGDPGGLATGLVGRAGLGTRLGRHAGLQVSGDARGWLGGDGQDFQAAWSLCPSVTFFVAF